MENEKKQLTYIPIEKLREHPDNPRKALGDLTELADSIRTNGIMQNLTVVPWADGSAYTVIIGHRRLAAAKLAGLSELPCAVVNMTPREQVATMLLENIQRSDLTMYEQAQGFQMMIDLGDTVAGIAEKTGFSQTNVRRRLKMAELDQKTLAEVSSRQISIADFDKLSKIEDMKERNRCLASAGTANFNAEVETAIKKQNIKKTLPLVKAEIKKLHACKIERSETYGGKYTRVDTTVRFYEWQPGDPLIKKVPSEKLFYYIDDYYGTIDFYTRRKADPPKRRPQSEIDREKYIAETRAALDEASALAYRLRRDFVKDLRMTEKNKNQMLSGAATACVAQMTFLYASGDKTAFREAVGAEDGNYGVALFKKFREAATDDKEKLYPIGIYTAMNDCESLKYYCGYSTDFPVYAPNIQLDMIYDWLISLGYQTSDQEVALRNGTHELYRDKEKVGQ